MCFIVCAVFINGDSLCILEKHHHQPKLNTNTKTKKKKKQQQKKISFHFVEFKGFLFFNFVAVRDSETK